MSLKALKIHIEYNINNILFLYLNSYMHLQNSSYV